MHCGIGRRIKQKKIPHENHVVNIASRLSLLRAPIGQNAFVFFLIRYRQLQKQGIIYVN